MVEIGASHPAPRIRGLGLTLTLRDEGVPARNLIGNDLGFKRPGFGIALAPGFIYTRGPHMLQFTVGKVLIRDRTKSVAEKVNGVHEGDAAFANYVWMAGYTIRMPGRKHAGEVEQTSNLVTPAHAAGQPAPPDGFESFSLKTLDGKKKTLQDFSNKLTLVSFFFPRCPYCNVELPEIQKIYDKYKDKGLSAVWINILPEEDGLVAGWQVSKGLTVPVLLGENQARLQRIYHINSTPSTYLLDQNGRIVLHKDGYTRGDEKSIENAIETALAPAPSVSSAPVPECVTVLR
jgi:cytochrome oxidase Cu insertion factor (SCO1/SenC/PrrC family)